MASLFFQENGVYTIAKLILPSKQKNAAKTNLLQVTSLSFAFYLKVLKSGEPLIRECVLLGIV